MLLPSRCESSSRPERWLPKRPVWRKREKTSKRPKPWPRWLTSSNYLFLNPAIFPRWKTSLHYLQTSLC